MTLNLSSHHPVPYFGKMMAFVIGDYSVLQLFQYDFLPISTWRLESGEGTTHIQLESK